MDQVACQRRVLWLLLFFCVGFLFLGGKLFWIQVLQGAELAGKAVRQRSHVLVTYDRRGDIQDRHRNSLLDGRQEWWLAAFPAHYRGREEEIIASLSAVEGVDRIAAPPYGVLPFWINAPLGEESIPLILSLPGLLPVPRVRRYGPQLLSAHVVGYLNESQGRGVSGIELAFDEALALGQSTVLTAPVDGKSRLIPGLGYRVREEKKGPQNVVLTLDAHLQRRVEQIMDQQIAQGAVVVMDPWKGDILAMASRPNFHPGHLWDYLQQGEAALINRALWGYQPGSIFKTLVAATALEEQVATLFTGYRCPGAITVDGMTIPCSNLHPREELTLVEAFAYSCNSVFIQLALALGAEKLDRYARAAGFGEVTGLPVGEKAGLLPAVNDLQNRRALANLAVGQGDILTTPLQVAVLMSAIANGGRVIEPRLVLALTDPYGREMRRFLPRCGEVIFSAATVNRLKYLLHAVIEQGTGRRAAVTRQPAGAKTGTAQSGRLREGREVLNYWMAGFYPLEKPRAVVVVFADEMKQGTVHQVFGEIIYFLENN